MAAVMDDSQSSASGRSTSKLLRYPLRSASRSNQGKQPGSDSSLSASALKREKAASNVSKSVSVLDFSGKERSASAKPPRRFSVTYKTPDSKEAKRTAGAQGKSDTPASDISRSFYRKKFSVLSSASYWLSQIKLSESASKHSISLGFFKLALEAGSEPIQRMSDELKSYVHRHNLSEFEEVIKELFESYKISDNIEQSQESGICSQVPAEGNQLSDDDIGSTSSSVTDAEKLKPKALNVEADENNQVKKPSSKTNKIADSVKRTRASTKNSASSKSVSEERGRSTQKKSQKPIKQTPVEKEKLTKQGKKTSSACEGPVSSEPDEALQENKENTDVQPQPQSEESTQVDV